MNLIKLLTDQRAYEGITHSRWGASWNWRWRRVGDDEERRSPSLEPQTDSRSTLPRKNRAWQQLCLVDHDNYFFLNFFSKNRNLWCQGWGLRGHQVGTTHLGVPGEGRALVGCAGHALVGCAHPGAPLRQDLAPEILIIDIKNPRKVSFHSENFYFCTKTTPW